MEQKVAQDFSKVFYQFLLEKLLLKLTQKVTKYFGYFCKTICHQERLKIAQADHTADRENITMIMTSEARDWEFCSCS